MRELSLCFRESECETVLQDSQTNFQKETGRSPPPWVYCASGIQGLQFPMLGSLVFTYCVAYDPICEAGSGVTERTSKV